MIIIIQTRDNMVFLDLILINTEHVEPSFFLEEKSEESPTLIVSAYSAVVI